MKKASMLLSSLVILMLLLAACAPGNNIANNSMGNDNLSGAETDPLMGGDTNSGSDLDNGPDDIDLGTPGASGSDLGTTPGAALPNTGDQGASGALNTPAAGGALSTPMATSGSITEPTDAATAAATSTGSGAASTPAATSGATQGGVSATPAMTETVRGAEVLPNTGRESMTRLTALMGFSLVDASGNALGTVNDYVLNFCEAHILYMVVSPSSDVRLQNGENLLVPFEMVTLQDGVIDVDQRAFQTTLSADQLSQAPAIQATFDLAGQEWEGEVQNYWSNVGPINLTSECNVAAPDGEGGVTVNKLAYATELLETELRDGNDVRLGEVQDVVVEPESGQLQYVIVRLDGAVNTQAALVPVPIRALNIPDRQTNQSGAESTHLILLVEPSILEGAPGMDAADAPGDAWRDGAFDYWSQHVELQQRDHPVAPVQ